MKKLALCVLLVAPTASRDCSSEEARQPDHEEQVKEPGDRGTNEGARGRVNATNEAARESEPPGRPPKLP
jgi:hypothetical protein